MSDNDAFQIHRYVDGDMTREEALAFERQMEQDDALAGQVAEIMTMDEALRAAIPTPSEAHLAGLMSAADQPVQSPVPWRQLAAAVALVAVGFGSGLFMGKTAPAKDVTDDLLRSASAAHALYSVEVVHPVEVTAGERDHLKGWLSNRLGSEVRIPDLNGQGLSLVGGRLLPFEQGAAAQFMYEDGQGARVTLYLTPTPDQANRSLRYGEADALSLVYWQAGPWHYALVGPFDKDRMTALAQSVQGALF